MNEKRKQAERVKRQLNQTAAERYADIKDDVAAILDLIGQELDVHAKVAAAHPKNWGNVGDIASVRETLKDVLAVFLTGRLGTDTYRFIEDHLESLREDKR